MTEGFSRVARSVRGSWAENTYLGVAAVATPDGVVVAHLGDTGRKVFLRSGAKPVQILPLLAAGGRERFNLSAAEIALICSSHVGSDAHVRALKSLLDRAGLAQESLACGIHQPLDRGARALLRDRGESPGVLHNNCSANHAGQLMACLALGLPTEGYRAPAHPLQQRVLELVGEFAGAGPEEIHIGVDGCGLPSFCMATEKAARFYACLADPEAGGIEPELARHSATAIGAMASHPDVVAGNGHFTTELIRATGGRLIGKEGAEGFYGVAVRGPVALGVALKIADGSEKCRDGVVLEILRQAGCLSSVEFDQLESFYRKELRNCLGETIGELAPDLELLHELSTESIPAEDAG